MFPELGERIVVLKQERTAICDAGQHVRWCSQRIVPPLANKPLRARPAVAPRPPDEAGSDRIPEYVPNGRQKVAAVEREGVGPSLEQVATPAFSEVDAARVPSMCFSHSESEALLLRGNRDEMHVIRHQAPCDVLDAEAPVLLRQLLQILDSIGVAEEEFILRTPRWTM